MATSTINEFNDLEFDLSDFDLDQVVMDSLENVYLEEGDFPITGESE